MKTMIIRLVFGLFILTLVALFLIGCWKSAVSGEDGPDSRTPDMSGS
ncbi:MAG: hypothetical protein GY847_19885 [Proteobacteria bacterium]|nr:hypothetical protein [Pseudomonadota bacterium]